MADIFISYKREDVGLAKVLADHLQKEGWSVWWDHEIPSGKDYDVVIEKELENCKCAIVLWTPVSIQSRNVKDEANVALYKNKLLPVIVGNVQPPLGFRMIQGVIWNDNNRIEDSELAELKKQVASMFNSSTGETVPIKKQPAKRSFKKAWIIGACIIGVIVLLIVFFTDNPVDYGERGWKYFDKGDYAAAIENFNADCQREPNPYSEVGAAMSYFVLDSTDSAKARYDKAIALEPKWEGNFEELTSSTSFTGGQVTILKNLYRELYTAKVIEEEN